MVSQEQLDKVEQQEPVAESETVLSSTEEQSATPPPASAEAPSKVASSAEQEATATPAPAKKKRSKKKAEPVREEDIMPRPSFWPFVLAFSIAVLLLGAVWNWVILCIGALLVIVSITGWVTERR